MDIAIRGLFILALCALVITPIILVALAIDQLAVHAANEAFARMAATLFIVVAGVTIGLELAS